MSRVLYLLLVFFVFAFDQATKYWACAMDPFLPLEITPFFNFVFTMNRGMSFGILNHGSNLIFYAVTSAVLALCGYLGYWFWKEKNKEILLGLSLVLGGALGNLCDRLLRQGVVDFLDFHFNTYHWPAFNVADSFIFCGVMLLLWNNIKHKR